MIETAIIYTRTNSKRLKNKSLLYIYKKKSLIEKVVENTLKIKSIKKIINAKINLKNDKIYKKILKKYKIEYYYGSTNNLIDRTIKCSNKFNFDYFLRICGDRPFFSNTYIDRVISNFNKRKRINYDLISNNKKKKLVDQGLTIEILSSNSLKKILKKRRKLTKYNLENITSYFYENKKKFKNILLQVTKKLVSKKKYTIDNLQDLKKMRKVISNIGYNTLI